MNDQDFIQTQQDLSDDIYALQERVRQNERTYVAENAPFGVGDRIEIVRHDHRDVYIETVTYEVVAIQASIEPSPRYDDKMLVALQVRLHEVTQSGKLHGGKNPRWSKLWPMDGEWRFTRYSTWHEVEATNG